MRPVPSAPIAEYLLDTGLIRSLNRTEEQMLLASKQHFRFTTSFIVPLEMLWAMPRVGAQDYQKQYRFRRAGLAKYDEIVGFDLTYWSDEDVVIAGAFGVTRPCTEKEGFRLLIQTCLHRSSLEDLENEVAAIGADGGRTASLDKLRQFLEEKRTRYRTTLQNAADRMRHAPVDFPLGSTLAFIIADWARRYVPLSMSTHRYDGSLDLYARVYAEYANEIATGKKAPGSKTDNDPYDIAQLCYLRCNDPNQYFVTTDQALLRVGKEVAPSRFIDKPTFLTNIT